tara:strand:- start:15790 stop:18858 length:3069 start_codon:yes stop_codon:yes gene_type:complete
MAELTFKSPGVSTREIDLSGPTAIQPRGIPAGIVGTSIRGPAFVPITFATFQDFVSTFGNTDGDKFGPLAVHEWMRNAGAGTYVRVLGIGDGKARNTGGSNPGNVTNAGYVVGDRLPKANGMVGDNPYTHTAGRGPLGRTYALGCFMSQANGSTVFTDAGLGQLAAGSDRARPILRGVVMAPSGVVISLSSSNANTTNNVPSTTNRAFGNFAAAADAGNPFGDVVTSSGKSQFVMLLNGHKVSDSYGNIVTASFDPKSPSYFANVFNTDPTKIQEAGHYLYAHWDIDPVLAVPSAAGMGLSERYSDRTTIGFMLSGSKGRNTGEASSATNAGAPNWESWEDRYSAAFSPAVISQKFGGSNLNLFKVHSRDDGVVGSRAFKITIENVQASTNENNKFGTFDLLVRRLDDNDMNPVVLESFRGLDLNPGSDRYVARVIGDTNTFYDFDKKAGGQKLVIEGKYPNSSQFIRIEADNDLDLGRLDDTALPCGFRGLHHLVTSGSTVGDLAAFTGSIDGSSEFDSLLTCKNITQLPVPMRETVAVGVAPKKTPEAALTWGVQFELKDSTTQPNQNQKLDPSIYGFTKWFPNFHTSFQNPWVGDNEGTVDLNGCVLDADRYLNNLFSLEQVEVITSSNNKPDAQQWSAATYRRNGTSVGSLTDRDGNTGIGSRFLDASIDFSHLPTRKYLKFSFPLQGGFDGVNIFDKDKSKLTDNAARREMDDSSAQGGTSGPTVAAYRKAIDVMEEKSDVDIQLLAIPGLRHESVTDYAVESTERRFDALFIMDIEEKDTVDAYVTASLDQNVNVTNTVNRFGGRSMDSSFAAAYFPDVVITDPSTATNVQCPPSVAVLGAFSLNDAVAHPWFAPAGFTRGALSSVVESQVKFNRTNLDELYTVDVNPLTSFPHTPGVVVFGQKTLLAAQSALDRVNVRRLLIDVRRKVKRVANSLLFEPNRTETLARFSAAVTPILTQIQQQQGLDRFKVQIDTTTTTQADVENNTIRGKIFLQPTRSVEFISLDFVVTNAGADV